MKVFIKDLISKNIVFFIAIGLMLFVILRTCKTDGNYLAGRNTSDTTTHYSYNYIKDSSNSKPTFVKGSRDTVLETVEYIPSQDYDELREQFQELKEALLSKNIYQDTHKVDTFGTIQVIDTVQQNRLIGRKYIDNLVIPTKTVTITNNIYEKPKGQVYVGLGASASQTELKSVDLGLLYKNKKDQIFGAKVGVDTKGQFNFGASSYWKINLKRK